MEYVVDGVREKGCLFCNRLASSDDVSALIVHRGKHAFVIMNLYPYNTGHVMIVSNAHAASPEALDHETTTELALLRAPLVRALRRALSPDGFNIGLNIGAVAGAGVASHLHEHLVPRWLGDANFMPIVAATTVVPELIPITYAKVRAELAREYRPNEPVISVIVSRDGQHVIARPDFCLPRMAIVESEAAWRALLLAARDAGIADAQLFGWAGDDPAGSGPAALGFTATPSTVQTQDGASWVGIVSAMAGPDRELIASAMRRLTLEE